MAFSASYSWQAATDPCTLDSVDLMWLRTLEMRKSDKAQGTINQNIRYTHQGSWSLVGNTDEVSNMSSIMDRRCRSCFFWIESAEDYLEIKEIQRWLRQGLFFWSWDFYFVHEAMGAFDDNTVHLCIYFVGPYPRCRMWLSSWYTIVVSSVFWKDPRKPCRRRWNFLYVLFFFTNLWLFKMPGQQNE